MVTDEKTIILKFGLKVGVRPKIDGGTGGISGLGAEWEGRSQLWVWGRWSRKPSKAFHLLPDSAARA